jgi:hypothetical protein
MLKAQIDAEHTVGIKIQLIMCFLQDIRDESAMQYLDLAKLHLN